MERFFNTAGPNRPDEQYTIDPLTRFDLDEVLQQHIAEWAPDVRVGDAVHKFRDAQDCIGELILKYDSPEQMMDIIRNNEDYIDVKTLEV